MGTTWTLCSWCDRENELGTRFCAGCGHRADVPRMRCDCARCRGGTVLEVVGFVEMQVFEFNDSEDGKTYLWNATEGRRLAEARGRMMEISVSEIGMTPEAVLSVCRDLETERALEMPDGVLAIPLLFVEHRDKAVLIDGWHRLYKACAMGIDLLPCYVLTHAEADRVRIG